MPAILRNATIYVLLSAIGGVVAFFLFAAAFNDPNWLFLKEASFILALALIIAGAFGFFIPKRWLSVGIAMALPIEFMALVFGVQVAMEGKNAVGWIAIGVSGLLVPLAGAWLGARIKKGY